MSAASRLMQAPRAALAEEPQTARSKQPGRQPATAAISTVHTGSTRTAADCTESLKSYGIGGTGCRFDYPKGQRPQPAEPNHSTTSRLGLPPTWPMLGALSTRRKSRLQNHRVNGTVGGPGKNAGAILAGSNCSSSPFRFETRIRT